MFGNMYNKYHYKNKKGQFRVIAIYLSFPDKENGMLHLIFSRGSDVPSTAAT